ncbi:SRPBCC family protein [Flagellimonas meridianipacifica]|uniref:Polyketide cyclase/dehydrase/lipid transport protein n=1 Tax=Flagellimonas meridianipacifica TaxID=1080225 RepID=A0A2T0MJ32_9FLAO|nr:SRPBCC family protein [Allomuricauda pacifica]PRX57591.1 polyketide cyclase/dehydrase/lipid transport protein [Allomuricauda pacifica]
MVIQRKMLINKTIAECWEVLGNQYTQIYKWASPVNHSEGDDALGINGASCNIRGCNVDGMGDISERLLEFDSDNYFLSYEIITGLPSIMKSGKNSWRLVSKYANQTEIIMKAHLEPKGFIGNLMKPMIKLQFNKMAKILVEDFKYYVENNQPHPRKVMAAKKYAA